MSKEQEDYKMSEENFRFFYQTQFDRIDKLETKRENFCNFVLTLSSAIIVFSLSTENRLIQYVNFLIVLICLINLTAIVFIVKTRPFIKMHQKRADLASQHNEVSFNNIKETVPKPNSDGDLINRSNLYVYLHSAIILIMTGIMAMENQWFCNR